jgi:hypothetical protein
MNITYTPSVELKIENKWQLIVSWMSGDGDAYIDEVYWADSKEEFTKIYSLFEKIFNFKKKHHNLFCDLRRESVTEINRQNEQFYELTRREKEIAVIREFMGDYEFLGELFEDVGIEASDDVTSEGTIASPESISSMNYWDCNGVKYDIKIS